MGTATEPTAIRTSDPPEFRGIFEANVGERELKAVAIPLAHGGQASPHV